MIQKLIELFNVYEYIVYPRWVVSTINKGNISIYMRVTVVGNGGTGIVYIF